MSQSLTQPSTGRYCTTPIVGLTALEAAVSEGFDQSWIDLAGEDPHATLFQSAGWCMTWYRCYQDQFEPHVLVVSHASRVVGLVPLALDRESGVLAFASGSMADYRDIVALQEHRRGVIHELLRYHERQGNEQPFQIGWLDPSSDTLEVIIDECSRMGFRVALRRQPCWRWRPPAPEKPSAAKFLKWYRRHGEVSFEVVDTSEKWCAFRDEYYLQHSLRQLQAGRPTAFDDPRRTAFYDALFRSSTVRTHVTGLRVNGDLIAGHFGYIWRDVLLLGPPSIRLEDEQRSPAVILLSWIIQSAEQWGLAGFDLTIGDSGFKKRLGNYCVTLTALDVYSKRGAYYRHIARSRLIGGAKRVVATLGSQAWDDVVKTRARRLQHKRARFQELGICRSLRIGIRAARSKVYERRVGLVYSMTKDQLRLSSPRIGEHDKVVVHDNRAEDLLLWRGTSVETSSALNEVARSYSRTRQMGRNLHTILFNGELAGWGFSYFPQEDAQLTETPGATLSFPPDSASLYDFHVIPAFRGRRLYQFLLVHILRNVFASGAERAFITVLSSNVASRSAIERVGFQLLERNQYRRIFWHESLARLS